MSNKKIPAKYKWLENEKSPQILIQSLKHFGLKEVVGSEHNKTIIDWGKAIGIRIPSDEQPWCGLFIAYACKMANIDVVKDPLWALNWAKWGSESKEPMLGDILTFKRNSGGHVGIYVGEDDKCFHVLGGNQSNMVSITRIEKSRLYKARRTDWKIAQPKNVRAILLDASGVVSKNEA